MRPEDRKKEGKKLQQRKKSRCKNEETKLHEKHQSLMNKDQMTDVQNFVKASISCELIGIKSINVIIC